MPRLCRSVVLILAVAVLLVPGVRAGETSVSVAVDYSTGDYGLDEDTEILYVPFSLKYEEGKWISKLTIPYIHITGPAVVFPDVGAVGGAAAREDRSEEGLGDIVASVSREVYVDPRFLLDITGKVKFATADEDRGLGTGGNDYSLQLDGYMPVGQPLLSERWVIKFLAMPRRPTWTTWPSRRPVSRTLFPAASAEAL